MSLTRLAALMAAASVLWSAAANAGGPVRAFRYGFWSGGAYTDERTGAFTHCSAGVAYDSGVNLFVLVTPQYRWWLGFINPKWSFAPNVKAPIGLRLDSGTPFDLHASVPNGQLLLVPLPDNSRLIDAFRHGAQLALDAEGQALFFRLNGTPGMMDRLTACVRTSLALADMAAARGSRSPSTFGPAAPAAAAAGEASSGQQVSSVAAGAPSADLPVARATSSTMPQNSTEHAAATPAKPAEAAAAPPTAAQQSANAPAASAETAANPTAASEQPGMVTNAGSPSSSSRSAASGSPSEKDAASPDLAAAPDEPPAASIAKSSAPPTAPAPLVKPTAAPTGSTPQSAGGSANRSIAALPPMPATTGDASARLQTPLPASDRPPLAFTAVNPMTSALQPPLPAAGPESAAGTALEEVRLATQFLSNARLRDAHLIAADKPAALADFAAVWRSEDAAGAVKIIPPRPDVSAITIASNLIAVDPQVCKGDFASARLRTDVGNQHVFGAVLTCNEANEERVTQYLIVPRQRGGFVVFAVIRSNNAGKIRDLDRQDLEALSRAAIQAVSGPG